MVFMAKNVNIVFVTKNVKMVVFYSKMLRWPIGINSMAALLGLNVKMVL